MPLVTINRLRGRWGNQIIEYAFLRTYAKRYRLDYQIHPWAGQPIFGFHDPLLRIALPEKLENYSTPGDYQTEPLPPNGPEFAEHAFSGWAQYHTNYYAPDREFIQALYAHVEPAYAGPLPDALAKFLAVPGAKIGLHIRRGDFGRMCFFLTPVSWYRRWLDQNLARFDRPVAFIGSEDPSVIAAFADYHPVTIEDFGLRWNRDDFLSEWWFLKHCDVVLTPNSTYSFTAAWLNPHLVECWRSQLTTQTFQRIDPWSCEMQWKETVDQYPGIPGTSLDDNPEWLGGPKPKCKAVPE